MNQHTFGRLTVHLLEPIGRRSALAASIRTPRTPPKRLGFVALLLAYPK